MTLQNRCRLVFISRKHQRASTRFIAKPYVALVLLLLFGALLPASALAQQNPYVEEEFFIHTTGQPRVEYTVTNPYPSTIGDVVGLVIEIEEANSFGGTIVTKNRH